MAIAVPKHRLQENKWLIFVAQTTKKKTLPTKKDLVNVVISCY
jgi:hypothetical protein